MLDKAIYCDLCAFTEQKPLRTTGFRSGPREIERATFRSRRYFDPVRWFRVSPFIFMKIKSDERKRVYKKRREKIKDNYMSRRRNEYRSGSSAIYD